MRVRWSEQARSDLLAIADYVGDHDVDAAAALLRSLRDAARRLSAHPQIGRIVPEFESPNLRERIVPPYRIIYVLRTNEVVVLTVVHGRRDLPSTFEPPLDE